MASFIVRKIWLLVHEVSHAACASEAKAYMLPGYPLKILFLLHLFLTIAMPGVDRAVLPLGSQFRGFLKSDDYCLGMYPIWVWPDGIMFITSVKASPAGERILLFYCRDTRTAAIVLELFPFQVFELGPWRMVCEPGMKAITLPERHADGRNIEYISKGYCVPEGSAKWHIMLRNVRHCLDSALDLFQQIYPYIPGALFIAWTLMNGDFFEADFITITPLVGNLAERSSLTQTAQSAVIFDKAFKPGVQYRTCAESSYDFDLNLAFIPAMSALYAN